jgi:hypothetical protein
MVSHSANTTLPFIIGDFLSFFVSISKGFMGKYRVQQKIKPRKSPFLQVDQLVLLGCVVTLLMQRRARTRPTDECFTKQEVELELPNGRFAVK